MASGRRREATHSSVRELPQEARDATRRIDAREGSVLLGPGVLASWVDSSADAGNRGAVASPDLAAARSDECQRLRRELILRGSVLPATFGLGIHGGDLIDLLDPAGNSRAAASAAARLERPMWHATVPCALPLRGGRRFANDLHLQR